MDVCVENGKLVNGNRHLTIWDLYQ
jgi:hypothetical protein